MASLATFLKKHTLWAGFLAVLAPLLVMLALQFVWLARLKHVSAVAEKAAHTNYLEAVGTEAQFYYRSTAERALNIPASLFAQKRLDEVGMFWKKKPVEGVRRLFLVDFTRDRFGNYFVFDPEHGALVQFPASDEALAVIVACTPLQITSYRGGVAPSQGVRVDERNPEYRLILNPITDDASRIVGIAGMILDEDFFKSTLLPSITKKALPAFFPGTGAGDLALTVRDAAGRIMLATGGEHEEHEESAATARFPFVFTDWTMSLRSPGTTPEKWANANFIFNVTLSTLLAVVLMGGISLALRAADRAVRLSEMKSDFVSNVSHELRTPLSSIRVFAELLRLGRVQSPEKVQEYGEYIDAESRRLSRLIDNILDFSRIESGRKEYRFVDADLREVVATGLRTFETHRKQSGFRIVVEGLDDPLPRVSIDPDAVAQALHNLLDNAVKYSGDSREIVVRLAREGDTGVALSVRDHGIGIARSEHEKIFDRFHRAGTTLVHEVKGSGLGLSIVQHIVRMHGGTIVLESEPGKGSTFTIRLPLRRGSPGDERVTPRGGDQAAAPARSPGARG